MLQYIATVVQFASFKMIVDDGDQRFETLKKLK